MEEISIKGNWLSACKILIRQPIYEWAAENLTMPPVITKGRKFDVYVSRHFIDIFDAIADDKVREINILAPPRSGKTLIADITVPWAILFDNASILYIIQTDEMAASHAELRVMPILLSCEAIKRILPVNKYKLRNTEIVFSTGLPLIITGPAVTQLQNRGFKYVIIDEAWIIADKYPGRIEEAKNRLGDFIREQSSKLIICSQGGKEGDDWYRHYMLGNIHEWHVQCMGCGKHIKPVFNYRREDKTRAGLIWETKYNDDGSINVATAIETVRYECQLCGHVHFDNTKTKEFWNRTGKYISDAHGNEKRKSFHWNNIIDYPWAEIVEKYIEAKNAQEQGNEIAMVQFIQKQLAEFYYPGAAEDVHEVPVVMVDMTGNKHWEKQDYIFMTVDVQAYDFWVMISAWSKQGENMILYADKVFTWQSIEELQEKYNIPNHCVFIDCGFRQAEVFTQCAMHYKVENGKIRCWWALKGTKNDWFNIPVRIGGVSRRIKLPYSWPPEKGDPVLGLHKDDPNRQKLKGRYCPYIMWANNTIKDIAGQRRRMMENGIKCYVANTVSREFFSQMYSEKKRKVIKSNGEIEWRWEKVGRAENHLWDCFCMQIVAACICRIIGGFEDQKLLDNNNNANIDNKSV